jgi:hypothetical protein
MNIAEIIEKNLHRLDSVCVQTNRESKSHDKIAKINADIKKCSCEIDNADFNGEVKTFQNPFKNKPVIHEATATKIHYWGDGEKAGETKFAIQIIY